MGDTKEQQVTDKTGTEAEKTIGETKAGEAEELKTYTLTDVKSHKEDKDCWVVIHGKVYDVTKYLDDHPGGPEIILDVSGGDATEDFEDTGHSADARDILKEYFIGNLDSSKSKSSSSSDMHDGADVSGGNERKGSPEMMIVLGIGAVVLAILAAVYYGEVQQFLESL